ncbi:MAG: metal ABC transporter substrate-binding protein, partial [Chloroflexi bacterium]|nr:metal ABC transporter substrate-binding protein [Chloroflexota bacterium]
MKRKFFACSGLFLITVILLAACQQSFQPVDHSKKTLVVTYSILGSVVKELTGDSVNVIVLMPNGADPHEWDPSAKDIELLNKADLIVQNGLELESNMQRTLKEASSMGVKTFTAAEHITIRKIGQGEGIPIGDPDQAVGADDPHLWTDPLAMKNAAGALAVQIKNELGIDVDSRSIDLQNRLDELNKELTGIVSTLPAADRKLVTGHESMGYFAQRYGFKLIGAIIPSITSQAEVSAASLAELKKLIENNQVKAIFTELGTSSAVADAIGKETGVKVIGITTHSLPEDGSYFTFER